MCRWAAWIGAPIFLDQIVSEPSHSLLEQSHHAAKAKTAINADGFGVAWYNHHDFPGQYRDVYPAWSDSNLAALAQQVRSRLFMAHVRASTGAAISRNNCHPFVVGKWAFMHNGQVGGFEKFRKSADMAIADEFYQHRRGASDSEAIFLHALGYGLERDPLPAMERAVLDLQTRSEQFGEGPHMRLSAAFTDGKRLYAVRYASDCWAPSMFYRYVPDRDGFMVVSEPLDAGHKDWTEVQPGSALCFDGCNVVETHFLQETRERVA